MLDTLTIARNLRDAGFTEKQADALAAAVRQASGIDLSQLATQADLKAEISATKADLKAEISDAKSEILKWVFGMIMGSVLINVGTMIALV